MKIPWWLVLLLFAGYSYWAVNHWHCVRCHCCGGIEPPVAQTSGVPLFKWSAAQAETDANFAKWKKVFLAKGGQGDTLVITGLYRAAETFAEKTGNLGLARAAAIKSMLMPEMPGSRIRLASKALTDDWSATSAPREGAEFAWLKMVLKKEAGAIIEQDNAVTFLFPFNSTEKDSDPAVDEYLKKLVEKHKATATNFLLVGHTDDVGSPEKNHALGLARANAIAKILTVNGIAATRTKTESKGETEPVGENTTDEGRQKNRRVVLTVQ